MKTLKSKEYWYNTYKNTIYPLLKEKVESNDDKDIKWDNAVLDAIDFVVEKILGPDK